MYDVFLEGINKELNGSLSDAEFEVLANECQMTYVKNRYHEFEQFQKRIDDLRSLKRAEFITPTSGKEIDFEVATTSAGEQIVEDSPSVDGRFGYLFMLNAAVIWNYSGNDCFADGTLWGGSEDDAYKYLVALKPMKADKLHEIRSDYYNMPTDERPYYDLRSSGNSRNVMVLINDTASTPNTVRIEYLVHPRTILLANTGIDDVDLPIHARQEVVNLMVRTYVERMESQRTNSVFQAQATNIE